MEEVILGGGYTCSVCGQYQRTSALCHHNNNLILEDIIKTNMSKEEFYKYGELLGISINDLQRLKMLAIADKKYSKQDIQNVLDGFTNEAPGQYIKTNFIELLSKQKI